MFYFIVIMIGGCYVGYQLFGAFFGLLPPLLALLIVPSVAWNDYKNWKAKQPGKDGNTESKNVIRFKRRKKDPEPEPETDENGIPYL